MHPDIVQRIAIHRRRLSLWLLVLGAIQSGSGAALAQPTVKQEAAGARSPQPPPAPAQPPEPETSWSEPPEPEPEPETYRGLLGGAYALAPLLARIAGNGMLQLTGSEAAAVAVGAPLLVLPAAVHAYEADTGRAGKSFSLMLGSMAVGAVVVGSLIYALGPIMCVDSCEDPTPIPAHVAALGGAWAGYVIFAVYDVIKHATVPAPPNNGHQGSTVSFWLLPLPPKSPERESARPPGLQLGASLQF